MKSPPKAFGLAACLLCLVCAVPAAPSAEAQEALVSRWTFARTNLSGNTVSNQVGTIHATLVGPASWSDKPDSLALDGAQSYVRLAASMDTSQLPGTNITAEAWVALRTVTEWGGIVGCIQDNGSFERGWLLGYRNWNFCWAISAKGTLTYMTTPATTFVANKWYHVVGTYEGKSATPTMKLFVNGQPIASSTAQSGPILYAPAPYVIGAYQDDNEFYPMDGYIREVSIYNRALTPAEVQGRYVATSNLFPATVTPPPQPLAPELGPYVQFTGPSNAVVRWITASNQPSIVEFGESAAFGLRAEDLAPGTNHAVALAGLKPNTQYFYRVKQIVGGAEFNCETGDFETDFNFALPPLPEGATPFTNAPAGGFEASVAEAILAQTGITKGYALDYGCGEGRLALELARRSELHVVGVSENAAAVRQARERFRAAGLYGSQVTFLQAPLSKLPHTKDCFNLIISSDLLASTNLPGSAAEVLRVLRPGGGVALFGLPTGIRGGLQNWAALDQWVRASVTPRAASIISETGRMTMFTRAPLEGIGEWTHAYADPAQTACSHDTRVRGAGLKIQWFGEPGARGMLDRQSRNPPPLVANGRLYVQGNNRVYGQDAYNGQVLWSLEIPRLRRVNLPRDCSNQCADDDSLYLAVRDKLWRLEGYTGALRQAHPVPLGTNYDWGFVASVGERLYGSSVKRASAYTLYDGPAYWYDSTGIADTAKVCSDQLFCIDKTNSAPLWAYANGWIVNSTIALGGGSVFFVDSRNPALASQTTGRISASALWASNNLVALEAATGRLLWQKPITVPASLYPVVLYLSYADGKLLLTDSAGQFSLFCHSATNGAPLWSKTHAWSRDNHGAHMYHPIIMSNLVILEPYGYNLQTGAIVKSGLPVRGGCGTMSAAANTVHYINWDYAKGSMFLWDLDTDQRRQMSGSRASCWLALISGQGLVLLPTASGGCACRFPLQTSLGYSAP